MDNNTDKCKVGNWLVFEPTSGDEEYATIYPITKVNHDTKRFCVEYNQEPFWYSFSELNSTNLNKVNLTYCVDDKEALVLSLKGFTGFVNGYKPVDTNPVDYNRKDSRKV